MKDWFVSKTGRDVSTHIFQRGSPSDPRGPLTQGQVVDLLNEQQEEIERLKQDLKRYHPESWARITKRLTDERDEREEAARWLWHRVERPESDKQVIYKRYPWLEEE